MSDDVQPSLIQTKYAENVHTVRMSTAHRFE